MGALAAAYLQSLFPAPDNSMMTRLIAAPSSTTPSGSRILNFSAGPAAMPEEVLHEIQADLMDLRGSGIGILEHSHRGPVFEEVLSDALQDYRRVGRIPDSHEVLFLQGGGTLQFAMVPMNFLVPGATADYLDTGIWAHKAMVEARKVGSVHCAFDGASHRYSFVPKREDIVSSPSAAYLHYCSNNTVYGTRFETAPATGAPRVVDISSEAFARPHDFGSHVLTYACAQKNLGPSGIVLVVVDREFLAKATKSLPSMLSYADHVKAGSRLNTPNTFGIYAMGRMIRWIERNGGAEAFERRNAEKSRIIYDVIDQSAGFYRGLARPDSRSHVNVSFRLPNEQLDDLFVTEAAANSMDGLRGHRDAGGIRASMYNAFPIEGSRQLAVFMREFAARHG